MRIRFRRTCDWSEVLSARLPERIRFRRRDALCAPSDCPRVPDPVRVRRVRSVYEARSAQRSWSTNGSRPNQRIKGYTASNVPRR
jgi:hypothetical protein